MFLFLFDAGQLFCVVRLGSIEPLLCAALLPISGLLKHRRHRDKAGGCDVHYCDAALCALTVGGGQDIPGPCETSGIGPYKERWGDCCDDLPNGEREEGVLALFVCSGLVQILAHVPDKEAQYVYEHHCSCTPRRPWS